MTILQLQDIKVQMKGQVLLDVPSFSLEEGDVVGVIGPNGAGKSTFLKILSFLQMPSTGAIKYKGIETNADKLPLEWRRKFAVAMQQSLLLDTTVFQNVAIGLKLRKKKKEVEELVPYWLKMFNIEHLSNKQAKTLSGGEAQRVNLARAFIVEPEVVFLDEPFSALDFPTKVDLIKELKAIIQDTKTTTFFVSHDLFEINLLTNKLIVMMNGQIEQFGATKEVLARPNDMTAPFLQKWKELYEMKT